MLDLWPRKAGDGRMTDYNTQCSVQHQLLPKDQHTKPEEVSELIPMPLTTT